MNSKTAFLPPQNIIVKIIKLFILKHVIINQFFNDALVLQDLARFIF